LFVGLRAASRLSKKFEKVVRRKWLERISTEKEDPDALRLTILAGLMVPAALLAVP
jgi:hypothetical protein